MVIILKISEGYSRLDRRCVIAIVQRGGIFDLMVRLDDVIPAYVFSDSGKAQLQLFFQKSIGRTSTINSILSRQDIVEKRSYYSLTERIENKSCTSLINDLISVPSTTTSNAYVLKNELFIEFRFHHNKLLEVNSILSKVIGKNPDFRVVTVSMSRSLREKLESVNAQTSLSTVRFSMTLPQGNEIVSYLLKNHPDAVAEIEGRVLSEKGVKVILYTSKPANFNGIEVISEEEKVYEFFVLQNPLIEARRLGNEARIPRTAFFMTIDNDKLQDTTFIPTTEADEYLGIMMHLPTGSDQAFPLLEYYSEINKELWDWL